MTVYINPSVACGEITAPPSKSVCHRVLIAAALSHGSKINNIAQSDDIKATLGALKSLGADVLLNGGSATVGGLIPEIIKSVTVDANESGSTLRFLIPLCMMCGESVTFTGAKRLFERDLSVYEKIAVKQGIVFIKNENSLTVNGRLKSGEFNVRGDISSQFVSGLMFALPLLEGDSFISFTTRLESRPYIDMTVKALADFGIIIKPLQDGYFIKGGQVYKPREITVEGDYSNAAFLDAFNLLGGDVNVNGLDAETLQGDSVYKNIFKRIKSGGGFDLTDCPDLAPVLFALAVQFQGGRFTGTARLKIKESDRAAVMRDELSKFGAKISVKDNEVTVEKSTLHAPDKPLNSHNDHRVVMALSVLLSRYGGKIEGAEAVNKSYPEFFSDIKKIGIEVEIND